MDDITIPDAAVEAAARAAYEEGFLRHVRRTRLGFTWDDISDEARESWRQVVIAAAPYIAAQALRDAAKQIECQHVGSCLIVGNDYCNAPEDGSMVRSAMIARANRIEAGNG